MEVLDVKQALTGKGSGIDTKADHTYKNNIGNVDFSLEFSKDKISMYNHAKKNKVFLVGDKRKIGTEVVDFTHFEFLICMFRAVPQEDYYSMLRRFWCLLWPYLDKTIENYKIMSDNFETLIADSDALLKESAEDSLELQIYKAFCEKHLHKGMKKKLETFLTKEKEKVDEKLQEIRDREN